ncbi:penicillin-binding protein 2 [Brevirhabdus pacifica]|uniref:Penicillin-binding protein 2 n=1 Tax=Brevirhabdus pacifica TaxID=1267768 RepID=A0A1U7DGS1_9RHOB|nr:penicillin-binding protein 2 [Brevirhabdus pacifica]APX89135.1 penicillin-binding protein 2 [Brevirhabdus pacifica]OWU76806.1 penicillin-binding protein [Loktanella sp. 22II-4b]PJJ86273.1 peptidoglycan glycosyltransferase [Brevirhabdus pacifica]
MRRSHKETKESASRITRRGLIVGGAQAAFLGVLAMRMRQLQVEEADQYRLLAEENRINMRLLPPARGLIFDRHGIALAENAQNYRIVIVREDAGDVDATLARLSRLISLSPEDLEKAEKELKRRSSFVPVTIADRLPWEDIARVAVNAPALPGVTPDVGLSRNYPMKEDFAHIIGYVGPVSDYDLSKLEDPDPLLQIPKFQIGKSGAENRLEHLMRGKAGFKRIEVNAVGRVMRELDRKEGESGANIQLTIDAGLQNFVQARLRGESASSVVMDVRSGDLVAIGSTPSFDPNLFVRGISVADYRTLTENKYRPLANKSVQGTYPPGSTYKMVTALAALEAGVVGVEDRVYCKGWIEKGGRRFHCWKRSGHGQVKLKESLMRSCDVYYYDVAERVGIEKMSEMARRLGLGERHDIPMSAVNGGLAPTKAWKREQRGAEWVVGDTLNSAIGQGFVLASPLQLAVMTSRIATGLEVQPRLVKSVNGKEEPGGPWPELGISERSLKAVRNGMFAVSNNTRGTAYRTRIAADGMEIAGKTGTSQVRNISKAERARGVFRNEDLPWERRDHALFVAFAPADNPRYAVSVVVEHGGGGSTAAAPIARDIMLRALYGELPPLEAYPSDQRAAAQEMMDKLELREIALPDDGKVRA